jgi:GDP-L-fucose synthase
MDNDSKILVAGSNGMVGSAIVRKLKDLGYKNLVFGNRSWVDFTKQRETYLFFKDIKPEYVFLAAAKVGGIMANKKYKADFLTENLQIQTNIIQQSYNFGVKKLLFLGSSCIYPKFANQPITEDQLMTGPLEPTNDGYSLAKIAGIKMCQAYNEQYGFNAISLMPTNLYGPNDNFDLETSHVFPGFIARFHQAKLNNDSYVECWGDGSPFREFLHVDDLADASVYLMNSYDSPEIVNVGTGIDVTIKELAEKISKVVGYTGDIIWNTDKPNGTPRKLLNVDKLTNLGWKYKTELDEGIKKTYEWYLKNAN